MTGRHLIVNADDFGQSAGINRGVISAHERGIVTSASLMVRFPAAQQAAAYGRRATSLSVGLHVDLGEWVRSEAVWRPRYEVVPIDERDAVAAEVERQLAAFRQLMGRDPTHLDSHQHVHRNQPVRRVLVVLADRLGVPLRHRSHVVYRGEFYGQEGGRPYPQGITTENLLRILAELPQGFTELGCHPGDSGDVESPYDQERFQELRVLCDDRVRAAVDEGGITLCTFADVVPVSHQDVGER